MASTAETDNSTPIEVTLSIIRELITEINCTRSGGQVLDGQRLASVQDKLEDIEARLSRLEVDLALPQGPTIEDQFSQIEGVIVHVDPDGRQATVAGVGSTRYDVAVERLPPVRRELGSGVMIAPDFSHRTLHYRRQFSGEVGSVGRIVEVLRLDDGQVRLRLSEGLIVEPLGGLDCKAFQAGDLVRYDPQRLLVLERFPADIYAVGQIGEVVDIYTHWLAGAKRRRLHIRTGGGEGVLAEVGSTVEHEEFGIGDLVRIDASSLVVLERLKTYDVAEVRPEEVGDTSYEKIGGLHEAVLEVRKAIEWPYIYPNVYRAYALRSTKGLLLYGPPGCGKTLIAKAIVSNLRKRIAGELDRPGVQEHLQQLIHAQIKTFLVAHDIVNLDTPDAEIGKLQELRDRDPAGVPKTPHVRAFFLNISGPELLTKWVGETEQKIRKLFEKARRASGPYTPVVIFLDEIESMFQTRGSGISSDVEKTIVPQFLAELDGVRELRNVILIGASNRIDLIDPALLRPGRLDRKLKIDRPGRDAAVDILLKYLVDDLPLKGTAHNLACQLVEVLFHERSFLQICNNRGQQLIVPACAFVSGAILESIVTRAKNAAAESWIEAHGSDHQETMWPPDGETGRICWETLFYALQQEYDENKDHFAISLLGDQKSGRRRPLLEELTVTVYWDTGVTNRTEDLSPNLFEQRE